MYKKRGDRSYQVTHSSPVVGFLVYDASHLGSKKLSKLELNTNGKAISIAFNGSSSATGGNEAMKCAAFGAPGDVILSELSSTNICYSTTQGHFSIVIPIKKRHKILKLWILVFVAGFLGLILGTVVAGSLLCKRTQEMEREADEEENLKIYWIASSKMPRAQVTRTQPVLESKIVSNPLFPFRDLHTLVIYEVSTYFATLSPGINNSFLKDSQTTSE